MNKTELMEAIAERADVPKNEAQRYLDAFEEVVGDVLKSGDEIQITRALGSSTSGSRRPGRAGTLRPVRR
jgi:DNA-binding protein HU-beta